MSTEHDEAEAVRHLLAPMKARPGTLSPERQAALWQRIEAERARPPRAWWPVWACVAAAAGAVLWLAPLRSLPTVDLAAVARAPWVRPGSADRSDLREISHEINEIVGMRTLPSGARVEVAGRIRAVQASADMTELFLAEGRVTSHVPTLAAHQGFHVQTPSAQVTVRGTVFTVEHVGGATLVEVTEGRVLVQPVGERGWRLLEAGQRWKVQAATVAGLEAAQVAGDQVQALEIEALLHGGVLEGLERQNLLLRIGRTLDARDPAAAVMHWRRFEADAGPHAEEVAFRHADALRRLGWLTEARAAAARFREAFPQSARAAETAAW